MEEKIFSIPVEIIHGSAQIDLIVTVGASIGSAIEKVMDKYKSSFMLEDISSGDCVAFTSEIYKSKNNSKHIVICLDASKHASKVDIVDSVIHETTHAVLKMYDHPGTKHTQHLSLIHI